MDINASAPANLSDDERAAFIALVRMGGEVGNDALAANIANAKALVLGRIAGEILGIAALKRPQPSYRKRIGGEAGAPIGEANYPYELGYVFLMPEAQGKKLSHHLVAAALAHAEGCAMFATTRTDNGAMLATLAKAGFSQAGQDCSGRDVRKIRLLVRPASSSTDL